MISKFSKIAAQVIPAKHGLFLLNYADWEREVSECVTADLYPLCGVLLEKTKRIQIPGYKLPKKECCMLPLKIFWLDMDTFSGNAAKIKPLISSRSLFCSDFLVV